VIDAVLLPPRDEFHQLAEMPFCASIFVDALAVTGWNLYLMNVLQQDKQI